MFPNYYNSENLGRACKEWRKSHGYTLAQVGNEIGYTLNNVWGFEKGRNDNGVIFLWYITHGFTYEYYRDFCRKEGIEHYECEEQ